MDSLLVGSRSVVLQMHWFVAALVSESRVSSLVVERIAQLQPVMECSFLQTCCFMVELKQQLSVRPSRIGHLALLVLAGLATSLHQDRVDCCCLAGLRRATEHLHS